MKSLIYNRRGDIQSLIYTIVVLFSIGLIVLFINHLHYQVYSTLDEKLSENPRFNNTEAQQTISEIKDVEGGRIWDYGVLGIALGYVIVLGLTSFSTRLSPVFFWIYVIISIIGLFLGVALSNTWQEMASNPQFAETITRFPITNTLLGSIYPTFILAIISIVLVLTFGKFPGEK